MKLLLVEDERLLSEPLARGLRKRGYAVDCAYDGEAALEAWEVNEYDLMILDLNLPKLDGLEVLRRIRETDAAFRILILSARDTVEDKISGLDGGVNDYLTKPFDFGELEARIRNLLRQKVIVQNTALSCGSLQLNTSTAEVLFQGRQLELTKKEYSIHAYLMDHQDRLVTPTELIEHVWDSETDLFSNSFRFHIHSLRKKLAAAGAEEYIATLRGHGYRMAVPEEEPS